MKYFINKSFLVVILIIVQTPLLASAAEGLSGDSRVIKWMTSIGEYAAGDSASFILSVEPRSNTPSYKVRLEVEFENDEGVTSLSPREVGNLFSLVTFPLVPGYNDIRVKAFLEKNEECNEGIQTEICDDILLGENWRSIYIEVPIVEVPPNDPVLVVESDQDEIIETEMEATIEGVDTDGTGFTNINAAISVRAVANAYFSQNLDHTHVDHNGTLIPSNRIQYVSASELRILGPWTDGYNAVSLSTIDNYGASVSGEAYFWAGSRSIMVSLMGDAKETNGFSFGAILQDHQGVYDGVMVVAGNVGIIENVPALPIKVVSYKADQTSIYARGWYAEEFLDKSTNSVQLTPRLLHRDVNPLTSSQRLQSGDIVAASSWLQSEDGSMGDGWLTKLTDCYRENVPKQEMDDACNQAGGDKNWLFRVNGPVGGGPVTRTVVNSFSANGELIKLRYRYRIGSGLDSRPPPLPPPPNPRPPNWIPPRPWVPLFPTGDDYRIVIKGANGQVVAQGGDDLVTARNHWSGLGPWRELQYQPIAGEDVEIFIELKRGQNEFYTKGASIYLQKFGGKGFKIDRFDVENYKPDYLIGYTREWKSGKLMDYLSFDSHDVPNYSAGGVPFTRIRGLLSVRGAVTDEITKVVLDVMENGIVRSSTEASIESQDSVGRTLQGEFNWTGSRTGWVTADIPVPFATPIRDFEDRSYKIRARVYTKFNLDKFAEMTLPRDLTGLVYLGKYHIARRFENSTHSPAMRRDWGLGGDSWIRASLKKDIDYMLEAYNLSFNDASRMNGGQFPGEWDFGFSEPTGPHKGHDHGFDIDVGNTAKFFLDRNTSCVSQKRQARFLLKIVHDCRLSNIEEIYANNGIFKPSVEHPSTEVGLLDFWSEVGASSCPNKGKIKREAGHGSYFHVKFLNPSKVSPEDPVLCVDVCTACAQACESVNDDACDVD